MMKQSDVVAGTQVRLVHDPGQQGTLKGSTLPGPVGTVVAHVVIGGQTRIVPLDQLELIDVAEDVFTQVGSGRFGAAGDLDRILQHARIAGRLTNVLFSLETTNTEFHAFQYKPVLKILESPSNSLLIADEVGLGKTIEAGLIWTELRSRLDFRRMMVLCPSMLRSKWKRELEKRFGVQAVIVDAHDMLEWTRASEARLANGFVLIGSMQGLRPSKRSNASLELFKQFEELSVASKPFFDLLVIDEAHYLRNPASKTHKLGRALVDIADHRVLLSATPVHLGSEDLFQLLNLLDEATFNRPDFFDSILRANEPLYHARLALTSNPPDMAQATRQLIRAGAHELLDKSEQLQHLRDLVNGAGSNPDKRTLARLTHHVEEVNLLSSTVTRTRKRDVSEWRVVREPRTETVPMMPEERIAYDKVNSIVRDYVAQFVGDNPAFEALLLVIPQRQLSSCMAAAVRQWGNLRDSVSANSSLEGQEQDWDEQTDGDTDEEKVGRLTKTIVEHVDQLGTFESLRKNDSKYARLIDILTTFRQEYPGEKIVLFAFFRATLYYLQERLQEDGFHTSVLVGGLPNQDEILADFARPSGADILLSSEVASEGVDLQFSRFLINYDLPWNPMKIEQRIGRIDRLGQSAKKIVIWNLAYENTIDDRILQRLFDRLDIFRSALGDIEDVMGPEIMRLSVDLLRGNLSEAQQEARIEQTKRAIENRRRSEEHLEQQASHLVAHGDYVLQKIQNAQENHHWISDQDICRYVVPLIKQFYEGSSIEEISSTPPVFRIGLSNKAKIELTEYIRSERIQYTSRLLHAVGDVRCRFTSSVAFSDTEVEIINHLHPLVRFLGHLVDQHVSSMHGAVAVSMSASRLNDQLTPGQYIFVVQRWVVRGLRENNRLAFAVAPLHGATPLSSSISERLISTAALYSKPWINAQDFVESMQLQEKCLLLKLTELDHQFKAFHEDLERKNADLARLQKQNAERNYSTKVNKEYENMDKHRNYPGLMKVTENRIKRLENQYQLSMERISNRQLITYSNEDISAGVIDLT